MKGQQCFSDIEYGMRKRTTRREGFLDLMDSIIIWDEWCTYIEPFYYKSKRGRPPMGIEKMLRMYLLQVWFSLSDESVEDAIYDSYAFRKFMGINFAEEQAPDATTLLKFRHIIEENKIGEKLFSALRDYFDAAGVLYHGGSIVDATLIAAPSSTKNEKKERDPEMHQTKKGNQWYFGMKIHIGVDAGSGMVHNIEASSANVHDVDVAPKLIRILFKFALVIYTQIYSITHSYMTTVWNAIMMYMVIPLIGGFVCCVIANRKNFEFQRGAIKEKPSKQRLTVRMLVVICFIVIGFVLEMIRVTNRETVSIFVELSLNNTVIFEFLFGFSMCIISAIFPITYAVVEWMFCPVVRD